MISGCAACDYCLSGVLVRGWPGGRILAQVAADLSVPPLRFRSHLKFCAGRPCVTWPYPVFPFSPPRARASPDRLPVPVARNWSESTMTALRCFLCVLVLLCQARSCLFQNLAPTAAALLSVASHMEQYSNRILNHKIQNHQQ